MNTTTKRIAARVISTTVTETNPEADITELELTDEQARQFPVFIAAREALNAAAADLEGQRKKLGLPKYEAKQTVSLYAYVGHGRRRRRVLIGEIQCAPRAGYVVQDSFTNRVVEKLTPELIEALTGQ